MKNVIKIFIALSLFACVSCASNKPIPEDLTAMQLIQEGQNNFERGKYKISLRYYNAVLERFGNSNPNAYVEAMYEIGHIYMKEKKYDYARNVFNEIIELYSMTMPGQLPGAYRKLAEIGLEKLNKPLEEDNVN